MPVRYSKYNDERMATSKDEGNSSRREGPLPLDLEALDFLAEIIARDLLRKTQTEREEE